jgi:hypothetical protein
LCTALDQLGSGDSEHSKHSRRKNKEWLRYSGRREGKAVWRDAGWAGQLSQERELELDVYSRGPQASNAMSLWQCDRSTRPSMDHRYLTSGFRAAVFPVLLLWPGQLGVLHLQLQHAALRRLRLRPAAAVVGCVPSSPDPEQGPPQLCSRLQTSTRPCARIA